MEVRYFKSLTLENHKILYELVFNRMDIDTSTLFIPKGESTYLDISGYIV